MTLETSGIPSQEQIDKSYPPEHIRRRGPVAVFECFQRIPCDPCYWSCPHKAVLEFKDINDLPVVDYSKCTGCGVCVGRCPGLAIFVVHENYDDKRGLVALPHEFLPLPSPGDSVDLLDRAGGRLGTGEVIRVTGKSKGNTPVIWVAMDRSLVRDARAIRVRGDRH